MLARWRTTCPRSAAELRTLGTHRLTLAWIEPPATAAARAPNGGALRVNWRGGARRTTSTSGSTTTTARCSALDDGRAFLDRLLEDEHLYLELDLGWIWWGGDDPVQWLEAARGGCRWCTSRTSRSRA